MLEIAPPLRLSPRIGRKFGNGYESGGTFLSLQELFFTSTASAGFIFGIKPPAFSGLRGWGGEGKFCVAILILTLATIGLPGRLQTNIFFIFHTVDSRFTVKIIPSEAT